MTGSGSILMLTRGCVEGGVGTGTPGAAVGGGPGGHEPVLPPGPGVGAGASSASVTQYSSTRLLIPEIDDTPEGDVGERCSPAHDTATRAISNKINTDTSDFPLGNNISGSC